MEGIEIWQPAFVRERALKPLDVNMHYNILDYYNEEQVEYCIRPIRKKPSQSTHGYYRGVLIPFLLNKTELFRGWNAIRIHRLFAVTFLKDIKEENIKGKVFLVEYVLSTGEISQKRMNEFITELREWLLVEHQLETPEPEKK